MLANFNSREGDFMKEKRYPHFLQQNFPGIQPMRELTKALFKVLSNFAELQNIKYLTQRLHSL